MTQVLLSHFIFQKFGIYIFFGNFFVEKYFFGKISMYKSVKCDLRLFSCDFSAFHVLYKGNYHFWEESRN